MGEILQTFVTQKPILISMCSYNYSLIGSHVWAFYWAINFYHQWPQKVKLKVIHNGFLSLNTADRHIFAIVGSHMWAFWWHYELWPSVTLKGRTQHHAYFEWLITYITAHRHFLLLFTHRKPYLGFLIAPLTLTFGVLNLIDWKNFLQNKIFLADMRWKVLSIVITSEIVYWYYAINRTWPDNKSQPE